MSRRTIGIDEAGRGPWLGPMTLAAVAVDTVGARRLTRAGVQDSKRFGPSAAGRARRAEMAELVQQTALAYACRVVSVSVIDDHTFRGQLNALERTVAVELLGEVGVGPDDRIICDGARMFEPLRGRFPTLEARDQGESFHVSVAAASILAKHARDEAFAEIAARYDAEFGPIRGGGYVNPATRRFVEAYAAKYGELPPEARRSWGAEKVPLTGSPQGG